MTFGLPGTLIIALLTVSGQSVTMQDSSHGCVNRTCCWIVIYMPRDLIASFMA